MSGLIADIDECRIVVEQVIGKTNLADLVGPLTADNGALFNLIQVNEDEEAAVDLVDGGGRKVALLFVDVLADPVSQWTIRLRGWRLADDVASL